MTFASMIFGTLIAMIFGSAFHFWRGGGLKWLIIFNTFAICGFWFGHFVGGIINLNFIILGPINLGSALIGTILILFSGYFFSMAGLEKK
ncbi:MAG: hypothetical protein NTZ74_05940 [Chloroflexi bacterium]|nr:hypothetical protein [Chloroflexota bacterium]